MPASQFPIGAADDALFTDDAGVRWQYSAAKNRWIKAPITQEELLAVLGDRVAEWSAGVTVADLEPVVRDRPWFDTSTAVMSVWVASANAWVAVSGGTSGIAGSGIVVSSSEPSNRTGAWFDTTTATFAVWVESANAWVAVSGGADGKDGQDLTVTLAVKSVTASTYTVVADDVGVYLRFESTGTATVSLPPMAVAVGALLSLRNARTGDITITPNLGVTVNAIGGLLSVLPNTTAQLVHIGDNVWDLL